MPHVLITGTTESGKTTLARELIAGYKAAGIKTVVLDPLMDPKWNADHVTDSVDEFLSIWEHSRSLAMFIDEARETVSNYDKDMIRTATRGRHFGHNMHYITHRGAGFSVTVRSQCTYIFTFRMTPEDSKQIAGEFCQPELIEAAKLDRFEFLQGSRFGKITKGKTSGKI